MICYGDAQGSFSFIVPTDAFAMLMEISTILKALKRFYSYLPCVVIATKSYTDAFN